MRKGNNYSGARWAFSDKTPRKDRVEPKKASPSLSMMGGSNRPTETWTNKTTLQEAQELYERGEVVPDCDCHVFPCRHVLEDLGLLCTYCGAGPVGGPCECEGCH